MDEPPSSNLPLSDKPASEEISAPALRPFRADFSRRLMLLFASSFAAFSLTTWFLARVNNAADAPRDASTAEGVVREQLSALAKGESRVAYALFTPRYRAEVPFEAFDALVREHGAMFRTTSIRKETKFATLARSEITLRLESETGDRFVARYTLVIIEGRWWIDEMRWHVDSQPADRIIARGIENDRACANAHG